MSASTMADSLQDNRLGDKCPGGDRLENVNPENINTKNVNTANANTENVNSKNVNSENVNFENVHSGGNFLGDKQPEDQQPEDEYSEDEHSEEESSESEHSESEHSEGEEEQDSDEEEDEEEEDEGEWYDYLGIDSSDDNSKDDSDSDSDYGWDDDGEERDFPKFMQLPPEVRAIIWRKALPKGRILRIAPPSGNIEQWGLPREMFAPEILNPERFATMPLAGVCWESRSFIMRFGYEQLWDTLMDPLGNSFEGPWFCRGRDTFEPYSDEQIVQRTRYGMGEWIFH